MSINYLLLKEAEKDIMNQFLEFYNESLKIHTNLLEYIQNDDSDDKSLNDVSYENIIETNHNINIMNQDLLSNCIWLIQKDEPRASHLRFVIAIIYSIKYISNGCEYNLKIAKWLNKKKKSKILIEQIIYALNKTVDMSQRIYECLKNNNLSNEKDVLNEELIAFHKEIKSIFKKVSSNPNLNVSIGGDELINFILIIGYIERIIDAQEHIIKDFSYIRNF